MPVHSANTMLEAIQASLHQATRYNPDDAVKPAAVLWTDHDEQWRPVIPQLRKLMPGLLTYGDYQLETRTGPTIWLRCAIEHMLPELQLSDERLPVIYLPGISRQELRAGQDCPDQLKPLIELQYRGVCWTQRNGKDWTVEAFLISDDGGLGLEVARDAATRRALHSALTELAVTPISQLRGKRLEAEDFDRLFTEDTVKDLLVWLNEPEEIRKTWTQGKWKAFKSRCKAEYQFDPEKDGELVGAERLGKREGNWAAVWERFGESPALYPGIPELLRKAMPVNEDMFADASPWPQRNEQMEAQLREELLKLEHASAGKAREVIRTLEEKHGQRRSWVWSKLGWAPLAESLKHLARLAENTSNALGGASPDDIAAVYVRGAWSADLAALDALAAVKGTADVQAVGRAVRSLYLPWLESAAEHLQETIDKHAFPKSDERISTDAGGLILFADGLRFDVSNRLVESMRARGWEVALGKRWAGVPTVTATAKPAASPIAGAVMGGALGEDFLPNVAESGQGLSTDRFRKLLGAAGYEYIAQGETGDPTGRGWTEHGELDKLGHSLQAKLAGRIAEQIDLLLERIQVLFDAGWKEIRIVTDHGWLLIPGGLPKVDLPKYLTQSRWARCAAIKGASKVEVPTVPWYWNDQERVAVAPGVHCFGQGNEYAHGGISLQECLIPDIRISAGKTKAAAPVGIVQIKWLGLRCHVRIEPAQTDLTVDIRTKVNDPASSVTEKKSPDKEGVAKLLVVDDELEGSPAVIVVVDAGGHVVSKQPTIIGGED